MSSIATILMQALPATQAGNDLLLEWVRALLPASVALGAIYFMFTRWTKWVEREISDIRESMDDLKEVMEDIKETMSDMAVRNAKDHGDVKQELARLEERINNLRSPWELRRNGNA